MAPGRVKTSSSLHTGSLAAGLPSEDTYGSPTYSTTKVTLAWNGTVFGLALPCAVSINNDASLLPSCSNIGVPTACSCKTTWATFVACTYSVDKTSACWLSDCGGTVAAPSSADKSTACKQRPQHDVCLSNCTPAHIVEDPIDNCSIWLSPCMIHHCTHQHAMPMKDQERINPLRHQNLSRRVHAAAEALALCHWHSLLPTHRSDHYCDTFCGIASKEGTRRGVPPLRGTAV